MGAGAEDFPAGCRVRTPMMGVCTVAGASGAKVLVDHDDPGHRPGVAPPRGSYPAGELRRAAPPEDRAARPLAAAIKREFQGESDAPELLVAHSPIQGSPYERVYVGLAEAGEGCVIDGPHLCVSPAEELGDGAGWVCGRYEDGADHEGDVEMDVKTWEEAVAWVRAELSPGYDSGPVEYQLEKVDQGGDVQDMFEERTHAVAEAFGLEVNEDDESPHCGLIRLPDGRHVGLQFEVVVEEAP